MPELLLLTATESQAQETVVEVDPGTPKGDQASEIPPVFYWALWVPAFFVLVYMFAQVFGPKTDPGGPTTPPEDEPPE
jgi:hypothetical protein